MCGPARERGGRTAGRAGTQLVASGTSSCMTCSPSLSAHNSFPECSLCSREVSMSVEGNCRGREVLDTTQRHLVAACECARTSTSSQSNRLRGRSSYTKRSPDCARRAYLQSHLATPYKMQAGSASSVLTGPILPLKLPGLPDKAATTIQQLHLSVPKTNGSASPSWEC